MFKILEMDIARSVFSTDPSILVDIQNQRQNDSNKLLRRLETLHRQHSNKIASLDEDSAKPLICELVECYMKCTDSIKVSRAVEKLWQPFLPDYKDYIEACFEGHIMKVTRDKVNNLQYIFKFSVLLEHNKTVQDVIKRNLPVVVCWLSEELPPLLQLSPFTLSVSQCQCIYALVKIILQLFQVNSNELGIIIWKDLKSKTNAQEIFQKEVKVICTGLLHILCQTGYQTDCVLLSGAATALMVNSSKNPVFAQKVFYNILDSTLSHDTEFAKVFQNDDRWPSDIVDVKRLSNLTENETGTVALIRGLVTCGSNEILFHSLTDTSMPDQLASPMFMLLFTYTTSLCRGSITLHYQSFQILLSWHSRITKMPDWTENPETSNQVLWVIHQTLDIVMLNWDSPVEDVPEVVVEIFNHLMSLWSKFKGQKSDLPQSVLESVISTAWYVKGKYRIFAALLKLLDHRKVLEDYPGIKSQLLQCLTSNHLASTATNVYKAFLNQLQKLSKNKLKEEWESCWMDVLIEGLISENSLLRHNTSLHWVPVTLKLVPTSCVVIQNKLLTLMGTKKSNNCYTRLLHALTVVTKSMRVVTGSVDLSSTHVREALHCLDEDVRSEAIAMICSTLKKSEPISELEITLLKEALTYNIKIDSAPFRQYLGSNLRKLLTRLRDSCIPLLKSPDKNTEVLGRSVEFVDWFHSLCMNYSLPGSCYQRRKGSLDLLQMIYECFIYRPDDKQRKGFTPETALHLVDYAVKSGKWDFFCAESVQVLILCVLDGVNEIQTSAFNLLIKYQGFPSDDGVKKSDGLCCHLLRESLRLCNSPKGHESESGSVLCKLVYQKYIVSQSLSCIFTHDKHNNGYHVSVERSVNGDRLEFIHSLLDETKRQMELANKNLVQASKQYPIHGLILAMTRCVTETPDLLQSVSSEDAVHVIKQLVEFCQDVVNKMLNIMASVAGQDACPSFAEIGIALETLLLENQSDYTESTSQTPEFQYMLSWCWNNINESCSCLGDMTLSVVQSQVPVANTVIESISSTFITVLTKCRHKGVIEGCRTAFVKFCLALFLSNREQFYELPANLLSQVFTSLKNKVMSSSVTRRSAGLPIIVQAVLVSEKKVKRMVLLKKSVLKLFEIAQLPLEADTGQTDLPQVHGLNILNSLFSDASLSGSLTGHISQAVIMVIEEFGSTSWGVRNAATRFFSTLITRIFGQKKTSESSPVTFQELSSYYPELPPFLLTVLNEALDRDICDISQIHPGLFPVLTLLSCLNPADTKSETLRREIEMLREKTQPFLASPVYQIRHLVASALVSMVSMVDMVGFAERMLEQCQENLACNHLHGCLLCILQLIDHITRLTDVNRMMSLTLQLHHMLDVIPIVASGYIKLLTSLVNKHADLSVPDKVLQKIEKQCCNGDFTSIGVGIYMEQSVNFLFLYNQSKNGNLCRLVQKLLSSCSQDTRKACLEYLVSNVADDSQILDVYRHEILNILCSSLGSETYIPNLSTILQLITSLYINNNSVNTDSICKLKDWLQVNSCFFSQFVSLKAAMLPVWGIVIQNDLENTKEMGNILAINSWTESLLENTHVTNETQRLAVTQAMLIAGQAFFNLSNTEHREIISSAAVRILGCCLMLVQDEDPEIRQEACRFVSNLKFDTDTALFKYDSLHSSICFELLLDYAVKQFHFSSRCMHFLIAQLYTEGQLSKVIEEKMQTRFNQLFEQEDNSFFAEKIYNAFCLHRCLKNGVISIADGSIKSYILDYKAAVDKDMDTLMDILLKCDKDSVINICSDGAVLASICSVQLMCDLIDDTELSEKLYTTIKSGRLPLNLKSQLTNIITT